MLIRNVLILGGGSAGFITAITLKKKMPHLRVTIVRSKEMGVIGVGESTTVPVARHLHDFLGLPQREFYERAEPVWKLGIRFLWGKRPFFDYAFDPSVDTHHAGLRRPTGYYLSETSWDHASVGTALMTHHRAFARDAQGKPVITGGHAYHLYNPTLVSYLESFSEELGIDVQDEIVEEVLQDERGIAGLRLASGRIATGDLYVDCSGFRALLVGKALAEPFVSYKSTLFCSRAVITEWERTDEPIQPYTTCETMDCGWCWRIDHEHQISRGYVYAPEFISDSDAEAEFRRKNPKVKNTRIVKFLSGRYARTWVKNVLAMGNSAGFVEPLESTALGAMCSLNEILAETLMESGQDVGPTLIDVFNRRHARSWDAIRQFLGLHYRFNERLDTPFWRECRAGVDIGTAADIVAYYKEMGPSLLHRRDLLDPHDQFGMEGYLSMLVGQQVPYDNRYVPTPEERSRWEQIQQNNRQAAMNALTVPEALKLVREPSWEWPKDLYAHGL